MSEDDSRPKCEFCGAAWSDEMMQAFEMGLMGDCLLCGPTGDGPADIVCHACKRVVLAAVPPDSGESPHVHR